MRIHCVCVVRDEADVLGHTLDAALTWAHAIYAMDNGSTDGTWELLQDYARRHPQILVAGRTSEDFRHAMVSEVANRYLAHARKGDWWCRLDADEMYPNDPRAFLARIPSRHKVVYAIVVNYYFTDVDLAQYEQDPAAYVRHWTPERLRFYTTNYSDPRFVRHVPGLQWTDSWPAGIWDMSPAPERILMRNYNYRSPPQIERRIRIRTGHTEASRFRHEKKDVWAPVGFDARHVICPSSPGRTDELWRTRVVRAAALYEDDGRHPLRVNWDLVTPIWKPLPRHVRSARRVRQQARRLMEWWTATGRNGTR